MIFCSVELGCNMKFGIYLPQKAESTKVPVIYWLSGNDILFVIIIRFSKIPIGSVLLRE